MFRNLLKNAIGSLMNQRNDEETDDFAAQERINQIDEQMDDELIEEEHDDGLIGKKHLGLLKKLATGRVEEIDEDDIDIERLEKFAENNPDIIEKSSGFLGSFLG